MGAPPTPEWRGVVVGEVSTAPPGVSSGEMGADAIVWHGIRPSRSSSHYRQRATHA